MKKLIVAIITLLGLAVGGAVNAAAITLAESSLYYDGGIFPALSPGNYPGSITFTAHATTAGNHNIIIFVDAEIDESINTFFNEYGTANNTPAAGLSWEIDEPGFVFGDIYTNFTAGGLDNSNGVTAAAPDDVSMALGWNFLLAPGETATLSFFLSDVTRPGGFYLEQFDPDSQTSIFFSSTMQINGGGNPVPEPSTMLLLGAGLAGLGFYSRRRRNK